MTLFAAIVAGSMGHVIVALGLGMLASVVLANRYRRSVESDPAYVPPTDEELVAKHRSQTRGCVVFVVVVLGIMILAITWIVRQFEHARWN